jgi:hypothetical protein
MNAFEEYQAQASRVPLSLRNDLDRVRLPVRGLQEEAGRIGALLEAGIVSGKLNLDPRQTAELQDRLADTLWFVALLCHEAGIPLQDVAAHSLAQLQARMKNLDPDRR